MGLLCRLLIPDKFRQWNPQTALYSTSPSESCEVSVLNPIKHRRIWSVSDVRRDDCICQAPATGQKVSNNMDPCTANECNIVTVYLVLLTPVLLSCVHQRWSIGNPIGGMMSMNHTVSAAATAQGACSVGTEGQRLRLCFIPQRYLLSAFKLPYFPSMDLIG